jgi:UDP:flavonoid glycosyltransferase YjiC (YdhE family)
MHVILATVGTDGDVFPHVGLGAVLRGRGHQVTLAAPTTYRERVIALGLEFCPLVSASETAKMLANPDLWHPFRSGLMMARWGGPMIMRQYELLAGLARRDPGTVIVTNPGVLAARLVQETLGTRAASLLLQPGLLPSCDAPPEMPGGVTLPEWVPHALRPLYWLGVDVAGFGLVVNPWLNPVRRQLNLPPVRRLFRWWLSPERVIGLFPGWYAKPQADWPGQVRLCGFGRFDGTREELSEDVRRFCEEGAPPIAFTLGTGMAHPKGFFRTAQDACELLGARGLLLTKLRDAIPKKLPTTVRHVAYAPFRRLLPRCAAVVHHGGIGTTAAALETGCPQLVLPLAWDQEDNAARVVGLGVGLTLPTMRRTARHLNRALSKLIMPEFQNRCKAVAAQFTERDGLDVAADYVEQLLSKTAD